MMGIFHKKPNELGSIFGRHKKEKMTSKENEDEKSIVGASKTSNKPLRRTARKNNYTTKFRRLREDFDDSSSIPEYEPPKALALHGPFFLAEAASDKEGVEADSFVPDSIDVSVSAGDTVSTLEESLVETLHKQNANKKEIQSQSKSKEEEQEKNQPDDYLVKSNGWIINFAGKSFGDPIEELKSDSTKATTKEMKMVEPKFYKLKDSPLSKRSSEFAHPTFDDPFPSRPSEANVQFTCIEDIENDENVEKVSSVGSDDFHQFVVRKMQSVQKMTPDSKPKSKRDESMRKAAESIAITLSSSTPPRSRSRMVPKDGSVKRARKVLKDAKPHGNATPKKSIRSVHKEISSEPRRLHPAGSQLSHGQSTKSDPPSFMLGISTGSSRPASLQSYTDDSVLMVGNSSDDSLLKGSTITDDQENEQRMDTEDPFHIGTFSTPSYPSGPSDSHKSDQKFPKNGSNSTIDSQDDLIELIRVSSRRSDDESSKRPDPSPRSTQEPAFEPKFRSGSRNKVAPVFETNVQSTFQSQVDPVFQPKTAPSFRTQDGPAFEPKAPSSILHRGQKVLPRVGKQVNNVSDDDTKNIFTTKSSLSVPSAAPTNPSGIPSNAILGSMLFLAHSESTMALPGEQGRPSDPFDDKDNDMPDHLEIELLEQRTVSSVSEDACSFYHENFERWNNRAHRALNNLYSTYHSGSTKLNP